MRSCSVHIWIPWKAWGIRLIDRAGLAADVIRMFGSRDEDPVMNTAVESTPVMPLKPEAKRSLITADWVSAHASSLGGSLELDPKTIVSPLARDMLKQHGIILQDTSKG